MFNIALNTFREIFRNKFFGLIVFLGIVFLFFSLILDSLALSETRRVLFDFWLSFIELSGVAIVLFLGGSMIAREIEGRTIYLILSKPISRGSILLGKFMGFAGVITLTLVIETLLLIALLMYKWLSVDMVFALAIVGVYLKLLTLLALILLFSTFVSPMMAMFMTIAAYIVGQSGYVVLEYAQRQWSIWFENIARGIFAIFPNLTALNIKNYVGTDAVISMSTTGIAFLLAIIYIVIVLIIGATLFRKKSFDTV